MSSASASSPRVKWHVHGTHLFAVRLLRSTAGAYGLRSMTGPGHASALAFRSTMKRNTVRTLVAHNPVVAVVVGRCRLVGMSVAARGRLTARGKV